MSKTLPPLPPLPSWLDEFPHEHREWIVPRLQAYALAAIEATACAERDARIAELERKLKDAYDEGWNDCEKTHDGP